MFPYQNQPHLAEIHRHIEFNGNRLHNLLQAQLGNLKKKLCENPRKARNKTISICKTKKNLVP